MTFPLEYEILNIWNATITEHTAVSYTVRNNVWNADIRLGESVSFGLTAECAETVSFPEVFVLNRAGEVPEQSIFSASYVFHSDWGTGCNGEIILSNTSDVPLEDWELSFDYGREIVSISNAAIVSHEGTRYVIRNVVYNADISKTKFNAIVLTGWRQIELNRKLDPENNEDTDEDGLTDWEEVDIAHISWDTYGNIVLPTIQDCMNFTEKPYVEEGLDWYIKTSIQVPASSPSYQPIFEKIVSIGHILPILSDPTMEDSDGDGYGDGDEDKDGERNDPRPLQSDVARMVGFDTSSLEMKEAQDMISQKVMLEISTWSQKKYIDLQEYMEAPGKLGKIIINTCE